MVAWHHEPILGILQQLKLLDLAVLWACPENVVTEYWSPAAPFITELINLVYPQVSTLQIKNGHPLVQSIHSMFL